MECTKKNHIAAITINAVVTLLLLITMAILMAGMIYQRQDISNLRTKLQTIMDENGGIHREKDIASAHLVGSGNEVLSRPPPGDVYRVTSWKKQHVSENLFYDNNGHLITKVDGVYFVYCQMFYHHGNNSFNGFNVYIDNRRIMKAVYSVVNKYRKYHTHYTGGIFNITKGQRIWVGTTLIRTYFFNEVSSFFGAYLLHH